MITDVSKEALAAIQQGSFSLLQCEVIPYDVKDLEVIHKVKPFVEREPGNAIYQFKISMRAKDWAKNKDPRLTPLSVLKDKAIKAFDTHLKDLMKDVNEGTQFTYSRTPNSDFKDPERVAKYVGNRMGLLLTTVYDDIGDTYITAGEFVLEKD